MSLGLLKVCDWVWFGEWWISIHREWNVRERERWRTIVNGLWQLKWEQSASFLVHRFRVLLNIFIGRICSVFIVLRIKRSIDSILNIPSCWQMESIQYFRFSHMFSFLLCERYRTYPAVILCGKAASEHQNYNHNEDYGKWCVWCEQD